MLLDIVMRAISRRSLQGYVGGGRKYAVRLIRPVVGYHARKGALRSRRSPFLPECLLFDLLTKIIIEAHLLDRAQLCFEPIDVFFGIDQHVLQ